MLAAAEVERSLSDHSAIKAGIWTYSTRFERLAGLRPDTEPERVRGNKGGYATLEGRLFEQSGKDLSAWVRAGIADTRINQVSTAIGGGLTWGDASERIGLAISHARLGGPGRRALTEQGPSAARAETNLELSYAVGVIAGLTIQPDIQYVINPGYRHDVKNALVVGVRTVFELD